MKHCPRCGIDKALSEFCKNRSARDGLQTYCKPCGRAANRVSAAKKPEENKARLKAWAATNPERAKAAKERWKAMNPDRVTATAAAGYQRNKQAINERSQAWAAANPEKRRESVRKWRQRNRELDLLKCKKWRLENPEKAAAHAAKRRALKLQRTPRWVGPAELEAIAALYSTARYLSEKSGIEHEVDHYYPLRGARVSGLHVFANLRVITADENRRKGNRCPK